MLTLSLAYMALSDQQIRLAALNWLGAQTDLHGDVLPYTLLKQGFLLGDVRIPLVGPQGIFKPRDAEYPLSITTSPSGPYEDYFTSDHVLAYRYRGTDPHHRDNVGLRRAMVDKIPLVYFHGLRPGRYLVLYPVFIAGDDPAGLTFHVQADEQRALETPATTLTFEVVAQDDTEVRRRYVTAAVRQRIHQRSFREMVIRAYREQCSLCRLRRTNLLEAAHIIEDNHESGRAHITNGISLCVMHHAAFDREVIGITPDYVVTVRNDVLEEIDGPMLQHGLKEMHGNKLILPRQRANWPDREALEYRYDRFRRAG